MRRDLGRGMFPYLSIIGAIATTAATARTRFADDAVSAKHVVGRRLRDPDRLWQSVVDEPVSRAFLLAGGSRFHLWNYFSHDLLDDCGAVDCIRGMFFGNV